MIESRGSRLTRAAAHLRYRCRHLRRTPEERSRSRGACILASCIFVECIFENARAKNAFHLAKCLRCRCRHLRCFCRSGRAATVLGAPAAYLAKARTAFFLNFPTFCQIIDKICLVFGFIGSDFCKQIFHLQQVSRSTNHLLLLRCRGFCV